MQLKRDVDYVFRILFCIVNGASCGVKISELCKETSVPVTIAMRLCQQMADVDLIDIVNTETSEVRYRKNNNILDKTIFDVIKVFEGKIELFAVFGKSTKMYKHCGDVLKSIDGDLSELLKSVTVRMLMDVNYN